jgi:hypothetical protein
MPILTIGRVGLDVDLDDPEQLRDTVTTTRRITIRGTVLGSTLAETKALRDELGALIDRNQFVPVTWTGDASLDGFYLPRSVSIETRSLNESGFVPFQVGLDRIGTDGDLVFRSKRIGTVLANDHGVTEAESAPFWAPPRGADAVDLGSSIPGSINRTGSGGAMRIWRDLSYAAELYYSTAAAGYLNGRSRIETGTTLRERAGLTIANDVADWRLENELVRVTPNATSGRIDVSHHDGTSWETAKVWKFLADAGEAPWEYVAVLRNDPEEVAIRLSKGVTTGGISTLDLGLRRGSRIVTGHFTRFAAATLGVELATAEAGTAITPAGASSAVAVRKTTNDGAGNRYVVGTSKSHTADLVNGGIEKASVSSLDFFVGSEIGGTGAIAGDQAADLCLQYLGHVSERTIAVRR